jgi:hypothetical protein
VVAESFASTRSRRPCAGESLFDEGLLRAAAARGPAASEKEIYRVLAQNDEVENFCWPGWSRLRTGNKCCYFPSISSFFFASSFICLTVGL